MRRYIAVKKEKEIMEQEIAEIICNQCGNEIERNVPEPVVLHVNHRWGYGSKFDMENHQFDLCEECYEKFIAGFQVPVEMEG